jgi:hypothetical protein
MNKLTGAALDRAVANVLGIKSVYNCEKWGEERMVLTTKGGWTNKDIQDMEDNLEPERFQVTGNTVRVKYRSKDDVSGWYKHPLEDQLKEKNNG